jgi:signal transduction histidine kinase
MLTLRIASSSSRQNNTPITHFMNSNNLVDKFIYACSHDLRSPVTSIQGLLRIADYYPHNGDIHACLEMIEDCTTKMDTLLRKLQEYMIHNHHTLKIHPVNATELTRKIHHEFKEHLDTYAIRLGHEIKTTSQWLMDDDIILRILQHLVSNSIAYFDPEKKDRRIVIKIESTDRGSRVEVCDNGLGIPDDEQEKIFDVFYRATENSMGSGMGLFLVKGLVEKMGGSISCHSSLGDGTTIRIYFPVLKTSKKEETMSNANERLRVNR